MKETIRFPDKESASLYTSRNKVRIVNLCHIPEDGRLKTLSFVASSRQRVQDILDAGERVDGSSLFSSIEPGRSDIYVQPRLEKAFRDPFSETATLSFLCDYLDENGRPLDIAPQNVLRTAESRFKSITNLEMKALTELEFYIITKLETEPLFLGEPDRNYHESSPFALFERVRNGILFALATVGVNTKYAHAEVGRIIKGDGHEIMEQHEIELASENLMDAADAVAVAKWVVRNVCQKNGVSATFIPKIAIEHAGTGMHVHLGLFKNGESVIANSQGGVSEACLKVIGGILRCGSSLPAFGNPKPVSYARFRARKESPMSICWSARNRLAMIRIPLWWNHQRSVKADSRKTFEYRASDAFANPHLLISGLTVAAAYGANHDREATKLAERLRIENVPDQSKKLESLPTSCAQAADNLAKDRAVYEAENVFPQKLIDATIGKLKSFKDQDLWERLSVDHEAFSKITKEFWHYG